jgi:hypothetical protein
MISLNKLIIVMGYTDAVQEVLLWIDYLRKIFEIVGAAEFKYLAAISYIELGNVGGFCRVMDEIEDRSKYARHLKKYPQFETDAEYTDYVKKLLSDNIKPPRLTLREETKTYNRQIRYNRLIFAMDQYGIDSAPDAFFTNKTVLPRRVERSTAAITKKVLHEFFINMNSGDTVCEKISDAYRKLNIESYYGCRAVILRDLVYSVLKENQFPVSVMGLISKWTSIINGATPESEQIEAALKRLANSELRQIRRLIIAHITDEIINDPNLSIYMPAQSLFIAKALDAYDPIVRDHPMDPLSHVLKVYADALADIKRTICADAALRASTVSIVISFHYGSDDDDTSSDN